MPGLRHIAMQVPDPHTAAQLDERPACDHTRRWLHYCLQACLRMRPPVFVSVTSAPSATNER